MANFQSDLRDKRQRIWVVNTSTGFNRVSTVDIESIERLLWVFFTLDYITKTNQRILE